MKKSVFILAIIILIVLAGCQYFPGGSPIPPSPEEALSANTSTEKASTEKAPEPEAAADDLITQVVQKETKKEVVNVTNVTNVTEVGLNVSGSLNLQANLTLCPHLNKTFSCDMYDVRRCDFKQTIGTDGYYPDFINCRPGISKKGENPNYKYCLIQECRPLQKGNLVYAYGGPTIFAEYGYSESKPQGTLVTNYNLLRCGELDLEFMSSFDCTTYKSRLEGLWS